MIYVMQNNLLFLALSHLDAATYQVFLSKTIKITQISTQLKLFTAAIFTTLILRRVLSKMQWFSLVVLFVGVSLVNLQKEQPATAVSNTTERNSVTGALNRFRSTLGLLAVVVACIFSGFAGIYSEKILKGTAAVSVWIRNLQMAIFAIPSSMVTIYLKVSYTFI